MTNNDEAIRRLNNIISDESLTDKDRGIADLLVRNGMPELYDDLINFNFDMSDASRAVIAEEAARSGQGMSLADRAAATSELCRMAGLPDEAPRLVRAGVREGLAFGQIRQRVVDRLAADDERIGQISGHIPAGQARRNDAESGWAAAFARVHGEAEPAR